MVFFASYETESCIAVTSWTWLDFEPCTSCTPRKNCCVLSNYDVKPCHDRGVAMGDTGAVPPPLGRCPHSNFRRYACQQCVHYTGTEDTNTHLVTSEPPSLRILCQYTVTGKNGPPKQNAVKCTIYNTI